MSPCVRAQTDPHAFPARHPCTLCVTLADVSRQADAGTPPVGSLVAECLSRHQGERGGAGIMGRTQSHAIPNKGREDGSAIKDIGGIPTTTVCPDWDEELRSGYGEVRVQYKDEGHGSEEDQGLATGAHCQPNDQRHATTGSTTPPAAAETLAQKGG